MMDDRELLELAALAGGVHNDGEGPRVNDEQGFFLREWNPLQDDGDALRLAVKLGIGLRVNAEEGYSYAEFGLFTSGYCGSRHEEHGGNPCAATRRAIVRAAAEIGRSMKATPTTDQAT